MHEPVLDSEVSAALREGAPVLALESTLIAHGLPHPLNLETAAAMCAAAREAGAVPAVIGIGAGRIKIGLDEAELERFARGVGVEKASRRDLPVLLASGKDGATTVAGTMACAALAGIEVFATGGIGGVHRGVAESWDISADLRELGRTSIAVVCSGAKSILDVEKTLEYLETEGVPVVGFATERLPAFYVRDSGFATDACVADESEAARLILASRALRAAGVLIANPIPAPAALAPAELERWTQQAHERARREGVRGKALTPYLLDAIFELSGGQGLAANRALLVDNARVGALIAAALASMRSA